MEMRRETVDERLRPSERLKRPREFREIFGSGRCFRTACLRVHYSRNDRELSRLGLVVSRRVGNAVVRSRVRRLLREVFRRNKSRLPIPMDVVLVPRGEPRGHADYEAAFKSFTAKVARSREAEDRRNAGKESGAP
jgi:ribonuclease P protein component